MAANPMIKDVTRQRIRDAREELQTLLSGWAEKNAMVIDIGRITYTSDSFRFKAEFVNLARTYETPRISGATGITPRSSLPLGALPYGCQESWIGKKFRTAPGRGQYTITGFRPKATVNVVIATSERGAEYVWSAKEVEQHLKSGYTAAKRR